MNRLLLGWVLSLCLVASFSVMPLYAAQASSSGAESGGTKTVKEPTSQEEIASLQKKVLEERAVTTQNNNPAHQIKEESTKIDGVTTEDAASQKAHAVSEKNGATPAKAASISEKTDVTSEKAASSTPSEEAAKITSSVQTETTTYAEPPAKTTVSQGDNTSEKNAVSAEGYIPPAEVAPNAVSPSSDSQAVVVAEKRKPVKIAENSILPLRILTRPMSNLYKEPQDGSSVVQGNLPAFSTFFVYTRPGGEQRDMEEGWYEVGTDNRGTIVGWLKTADIFEWKQTLCLAYRHPDNRKPVLMFEGREYLSSLINDTPDKRAAVANGLYQTIDKGSLPENFQVVSIEPKRAIDITKEFYLLPILEHEVVTVDGREGRILKLAAVSGSGADARESSDIRQNIDYAKQAALSSAQASSGQVADLQIDIVWVIDTTVSMGPFIDLTRDVVQKASKQLTETNAKISSKIKFGAWAYRDPVEAIPGIEYTTKNFTPELQDIDSFVSTVSTIKETKVDSIDFPEDVFSGLSDAILKTKWSPNAVRFVVLVGDAPGHELGHKFNVSGYDETTVRALADEHKINLTALQVRPRGAKRHQKTAEKQFKVLSLNPGATTSAYFDVQGTDKKAFATSTETIVASVANIIKVIEEQGDLEGILEADAAPVGTLSGEQAALLEDSDEPATEGAQRSESQGVKKELSAAEIGLGQSIKAALVQWVGSSTGAKPPRDIVAWVTDKDLVDSSVQSMEVRLLINKNQLDTLANLLKDVIAAGRLGQISGDDFFTSLQSASAVATRDPNMLKNARSLAQSGLIPSFLEGLPYHSRLMDMSNDLWNSWSPDEQDSFLNELDARVKAYQAIHDNPQGWVTLNAGDDADESVYPMLLNLLP